MTKRILDATAKHIPQRKMKTNKLSHPWLTDEIVELVARKRAAEGTDRYEDAVKMCSQKIMIEYKAYAQKCRQRMLEARRGSKEWWTICREVLSQRARVHGIPALKAANGEWRHEARGKADLLAEGFTGKFVLPDSVANEYSFIESCPNGQRAPKDLTVTETREILADLDEQSGTGPDLLPSKILKVCGDQLAQPVRRLVALILNVGIWPACWRKHWVVAIHKRGAVYLTKNYRGVHMTSQLSKVVERLILNLITPHASLWSLTGVNQFAYTKKRGSRDVLTLLTMRWLQAIDRNKKVLVYCSDVSAAFDRVCKIRLLSKIKAQGFDVKLVKLISSWLEQRDANVVINGAQSTTFNIKDMVFQGTVLGPQLWNLFFADAAAAIREFMFFEMVYADDLDAYKIVPSSTGDDEAMRMMDKAQTELHKWGAANRVSFDPAKESKHVLSRKDPHGSEFKLLGVIFDCRLYMDVAISTLVGKVRWKIAMLLRSRASFSTEDMVVQYKQQILSVVEYRTGAIYHATTSILRKLDKVQESFLRQLGIDMKCALLDFNLAPLSMRRDIALLGVLHRAAIGEGPAQFREHFYRKAGSLRMYDVLEGTHPSLLMRRSIWGLVSIYNGLGGARDCSSVCDFQKLLHERAKRVVDKQLLPQWARLYSPR